MKEVEKKIDGSWKIYISDGEIQTIEDYSHGDVAIPEPEEMEKKWRDHIKRYKKKKHSPEEMGKFGSRHPQYSAKRQMDWYLKRAEEQYVRKIIREALLNEEY